VGTHPKTSHFTQFQTHFKAKHEKVWERRSHAFPPHYTPACKQYQIVCKKQTADPASFQQWHPCRAGFTYRL